MTATVLSVRELRKVCGDVKAMDGVSFDMEKSKIVGPLVLPAQK